MRIDTSGNVGIGTSSPLTRLHVQSTASNTMSRVTSELSGSLYYSGYEVTRSGTAGGALMRSFRSAALGGVGWEWLTTVDNAAELAGTYTSRMVLTNDGNVGIGTLSPVSKLNVTGGNVTVTEGYGIAWAGDQTRIMTPEDNVAGALINWSNGGICRFISGTSERMRIDNSGNLLVGTSSQTTSPSVGVQIANLSGTVGGVYVGHANGTATGNYYAAFSYNSGIIGSITQDGTTAVLYNTTSDSRLKHDIIDAPEASSLIDAIQVRSFKWNADNSEQRYGFIAQELVTVAPEAVSQPADPDDMMGVDYSKLVPMLVKEIQSLRARVAQLEGN